MLIDAAAEVAAARTAGAKVRAPFEFETAEAFLHKAREEQSHADFEVAVALARRARSCAAVARVRSEGLGTERLGGEVTGAEASAGPASAPDAQCDFEYVLFGEAATSSVADGPSASGEPDRERDRAREPETDGSPASRPEAEKP